MVNIIHGTTKKPISSKRLSYFFSKHVNYGGFLFIGYPVIGTPEGPFPIDALWISKEKGLIIFNLVEGKDLSNYQENQDDSANKLEAKLRTHRSLMEGRELKVPIHVITFIPLEGHVEDKKDEDYPLCNEDNLQECLEKLSWDSPVIYEELISVIQAISTIRKGRKKRVVQKEDSRGAKLKRLEDSIANLDNIQGRAVIETVDGVQRIRGLAGSGKTIVLALKAAYLHAQHPDWKIAVTFNTRSLKGQFRQFINTFTIEQTKEEPNWDNIQVINAWGAPGGGERNGLYYQFCLIHGLEYFDFKSAQSSFERGNEFEGVCDKVLEEGTQFMPEYDVILVDEAQDFPPSFLKLCYEFVKQPKRLVYAYDELQNLSTKSLPSPEQIFGIKPDGSPLVLFESSQQDIILEICYRNSRPVLTTAHALGFGIYRNPDKQTGTGLVQIFDHNKLWLDVGYKVESGELKDGSYVVLSRTEDSSPKFLEDHSDLDDLIMIHCFKTREEQARWVTEEIKKNLKEDELRPDDIVVINPDPRTTRKEVGIIRKFLYENEINSHLAGIDTSPDIFFDSKGDSITFTGVYRAKGNEAGMVYIINANDCYESVGNLATLRNQLFTAITRSKAWVRIVGIGPNIKKLKEEFERVKANNFKLKFIYPTERQKEHMNVIHRDMTEEERQRVKKGKGDLLSLLKDLESGKVQPEDLGQDLIGRLQKLFAMNS